MLQCARCQRRGTPAATQSGPAKPLAVMAANLASLAPWATIAPQEAAWLTQAARPIVLLRQTTQAQRELPGIAPGLATLGAMLPYAPVQYLLFHEAAQRPAGTAWLDEPQDLLGDDQRECLWLTAGHRQPRTWQQLSPLADALLLHDRDILHRADDSVLRVRPMAAPAGSVEDVVTHPNPCCGAQPSMPHVMASGGDLKATLCQVRAYPQRANGSLGLTPYWGPGRRSVPARLPRSSPCACANADESRRHQRPIARLSPATCTQTFQPPHRR